MCCRVPAQSDVIVGNDVEFGFMAGDYDKGLDKARELAGQSAAITVYKMGEKGAITFADGEEVRTGIYPVDALKPEGAGDSFMAGFMASLAWPRLERGDPARLGLCLDHGVQTRLRASHANHR
jgi:5-dehydro-2-deoxygluconokinase